MKAFFKRIYSAATKHYAACCGVWALLLTFIVEILSRHGFSGAFMYITAHPILFLYNALIIFAMFSVTLLASRRIFYFTLISVLWLTLGIVNCFLLSYRAAPLSLTDFRVFTAALGLINIYMTPWQIVLSAAGILTALTLLVLMFIRAPRFKSPLRHSVVTVCCTLLSLALTTGIGISAHKLDGEAMEENLAGAYDSYGFAYCFSRSVIERGITKPHDYSEETVDRIMESIQDGEAAQTLADTEAETSSPVSGSTSSDGNERPDIIFLQLESFIDVDTLDAVGVSENPTPYYKYLKENYPSGRLTTPVMGAGTVYTEFEMLTGISVRLFGLGECPYYTVLNDTACESIAYDLRPYGYTSHAIHNNTATFYDRDTVYPNLGFDTFTPIEYMSDIERNPLGWAKDSVLTGEIAKALDSTEGSDFIYTVSVQCHGRYDSEYTAQPGDITAWLDSGYTRENYPDADAEKITGFENSLTYYVNEEREVDDFMRGLTEYLEKREKPAVIVMFGDHMPDFGLAGDLTNDEFTPYDTEYVIWSNFSVEADDADLYAYELSARVCGLLGYSGGAIMELHQSFGADIPAMTTLAYDMLYGGEYFKNCMPDGFIHTDTPVYSPSQMSLGAGKITVSGAYTAGGRLYVTGKGFTEYSVITVDGTDHETEYISPTLLCADLGLTSRNSLIAATQKTEGGKALSHTNEVRVSSPVNGITDTFYELFSNAYS
ncbi:MAG: LTA synthase family protein [Eubacteriales bacterium]